METFYNTTGEAERLKEFTEKAGRQERETLEFFMNTCQAHSPADVWDKKFQMNCPITSVRRAMTNLTKKGILRKTGNKKPGIYGRDNFCWELVGSFKKSKFGFIF